MPATRSETGYVFDATSCLFLRSSHTPSRAAVLNDCDTATTNNAGCGVQVSQPNNYGPAFNSAGGGFYAMERTNSFIKVWFWSRTDENIPNDVLTGGSNINTDDWVSLVSSVCLTGISD